MSNESLMNVVKQVRGQARGKTWPALRLVGENPSDAALVSKLQRSSNPGNVDMSRADSVNNLNKTAIAAISENTKQRIRDNENIMQLFPETELAMQIVVSSILSPKDMVKADLIYKGKDSIFPSEVMMACNEFLQTEMDTAYKLKDDLQEILIEALYRVGSYVKLVLPESVVDEIINSRTSISTEAFGDFFETSKDGVDLKKISHLGFLGNAGQSKFSTVLESFANRDKISYNPKIHLPEEDSKLSVVFENLEIVDNFKILKMPGFNERLNKERVKTLIKGSHKKKTAANMSAESFSSVDTRTIPGQTENTDTRFTPQELQTILYKNGQQGVQNFMVLPTKIGTKRKSVGRPLVMRLPSESVIPVYVPGDPSNHIGYFVLIDIDGNPVTVNSQTQTYNDGMNGLVSSTNQAQSINSNLIDRARRNLVNNSNTPTLQDITSVYASVIEKNLMERLANGLYGQNAKVSDNQEIYRVMLARAYEGKFTRLVYIPGELVTYFAFKHFTNGVGKSYLDDIKNLTSLRAIMLFAKVNNSVKNSINVTKVDMKLDPESPDPNKDIEMAVHEIVKMRQNYFPLGINSYIDLNDWIQRAGLEFTFSGHPGLPDIDFEFSNGSMQHTMPDTELDELLRKQTFMAFGLPPETVDNAYAGEFATTVVQNNVLLSKRIMLHQQKFVADVCDFVQTVASNDSEIIRGLKEIIEENIGTIEAALSDEEKGKRAQDEEGFLDELVERYIENLLIDLPHPDGTSLKNQTEAFKEYMDAIEEALNYWVSSDMFTEDVVGAISTNFESLKKVLKAYFGRKWMAENGYMTELAVIANAGLKPGDEGSFDLYDENKEYMEGAVTSFMKFLQKMKPINNAAGKDLEALGTPEGSGSSGGGGGGGFDDGGGGSDGGFGSGGDDISLDLDGAAGAGGSDATPEGGDENPEGGGEGGTGGNPPEGGDDTAASGAP
jgi:hypothetical protein